MINFSNYADNMLLPGDDMQVEVEIPFMTSIFGGKENIRVRRLEECGTCTGSGIKPGAKVLNLHFDCLFL